MKKKRNDPNGISTRMSQYDRNHALLTDLASEVSVMKNEIRWIKKTFEDFKEAIDERMGTFEKKQWYTLTGIIISILLSIVMLLVKAIYHV